MLTADGVAKDSVASKDTSVADAAGSVSQAANESHAVASMVVGIISVVFVFFEIGLFLGPVAICLGLQAKKKMRESEGRLAGEGCALGGIMTGAVGLILGFVGAFCCCLDCRQNCRTSGYAKLSI